MWDRAFHEERDDMRRWVRSILTVLSLLVGVGLIVLWPRTTRMSEGVKFSASTATTYAFGTHPHGVGVMLATRRSPAGGWGFFRTAWGRATVPFEEFSSAHYVFKGAPWAGYWAFGGRTAIVNYWWWRPDHHLMGLGWEATGLRTYLVIPFWFLIILSLILPARWLQWHLRRRRRLRMGLCPECAYDLRASPERCPECGVPTPVGLVRGRLQ